MNARETLTAYVAASNRASRAYADYQRGDAAEREVWRLNREESEALDRHVEAIDALLATQSARAAS